MPSKLIALFEKVRDIPYRIALSKDEPVVDCMGKAEKLKVLFEKERLQVRWRVCDFKWSDVATIPEEVQRIPHEDACTHVYLEVYIDDGWKKVDPTWDKLLAPVLPVAEWDGRLDTVLAVPTLATRSPGESEQVIKTSGSEEFIEKDLAVNGAFYTAFNKWLDEVRHTAES